jgi:predicted nuclease of predicted toxin-antitoxin system
VKFLCDVHIPIKLVKHLQSNGFETIHVNNILQGSRTSDNEIANYADKNGFIVISKDADFKNSYLLKKCPQKLIRIGLGNISNEALISLFENNLKVIFKLSQRASFFMEILSFDIIFVYE